MFRFCEVITVATEIEMKLTVPSHEVMEQLLADPQLTEYMRDPLETCRMRSTYYDTPDHALQTRRWTLRLRDEGGAHIVAMKTPNASEETGFFTRHEWQCRAENPRQALPRLVDQGAPAELLSLIGDQTLVPICGADFERRCTCLYLPENVRIELAADEGVLSGGKNQMPICELELELLFGESEALPPIAQRLAQTYGLIEESQSKFIRALTLRETPAEA